MSTNVCPWWAGYFLIMPVRRMIQNPDKILHEYVSVNMKVMDIGCAMGFFSLPMAKMVGEKGKVICIDLQEKMIKTLMKRAEKANLLNRIEARVCGPDSLHVNDIKEQVDFVLAFAVVHEVKNKDRLFSEILKTMKPGSALLFVEPKGHVSYKEFQDNILLAEKNGFEVATQPKIARSYAVLLKKR